MASTVTSTYDLTTVDAVVRYLGGDPTVGVASYPLLQALVTAVSRQCATYCSRDFRLQDYDEVYNGVGSSRIILNNGPISSIASVAVGANTIPQASQPAGTGWTFAGKTLYYRGGSFCPGVQNVRVAYTSGFLTPGQAALLSPVGVSTVPEDLAESIIEAVALRWRRIPNEDKASVAIGDQSTSFIGTAIPATVKPVWDAYNLAMIW